MAAIRDEDVRGLDVPVNDPFDVRSIQAICNLDRQIQDLVRVQRLAQDALLQRLPLQQLHRDEVLAFVLVDVIDRADVGVIERRSRLGLALESFQGVAVFG